MTEKSDKPASKDGLVVDVVDEGVARQVSLDEEAQKAYAVRKYQIGEPCPRNLGDNNRGNREIDPTVAQSYPAGQQVTDPYDYETRTHKIRVKYADGHHPANRDDLVSAQIGVGTPHEHDDWKRSPPEVIDQAPEKSRLGYQSQFRVPDSSAVYSLIDGGDQMGYSTDDRAKYGHGVLGPGDRTTAVGLRACTSATLSASFR